MSVANGFVVENFSTGFQCCKSVCSLKDQCDCSFGWYIWDWQVYFSLNFRHKTRSL